MFMSGFGGGYPRDLLTKQSRFALVLDRERTQPRNRTAIFECDRARVGGLTGRAMRRIGIAAIAILASMLCSSVFAQSLRPSYSPDGTSAASREARIKQAVVHAPKPSPRQHSVTSRSVAARPQIQAQPDYASQAPPAPNRGFNDFFAAIFAGPSMFARAWRPAEPQYGGVPPANAYGYAPQAYAAPGQGNGDYSDDPKFLRQMVAYSGSEAPGTIIVDTTNKFLYLVEGDGRALRYGIGVGRPGFLWSGIKTVTAKREWPDWTPPAEMLGRRPDLPRFMPGGVDNPLGARALYLGSSLYRIHGSNEPWTIGTNVSSGCIRMRNEDVTDLYGRVKIGTKVIVI
jgi:lipoprotein-anchoring transpeptidase ErfK/SrfK